VSKDKKLQFNRIWAKGGKAKQTLLQKVEVRGLETTEKICFEYYMGWIKPFVVTKWGKVEHKNPYWDKYRKQNNARRGKKRFKGQNKNKDRKSRR
jgi:hypothetical protein